MSLTNIANALVAVGAGVSGVKNSYDFNEIPKVVSQVKLPCLFHIPSGGSMEMLTFRDNVWGLTHIIRVQMIYVAEGQSTAADNVSGLVALLDSYIAALHANSDLSGTCDNMTFEYSPTGRIPLSNVDYLGVEITVRATEYIYA